MKTKNNYLRQNHRYTCHYITCFKDFEIMKKTHLSCVSFVHYQFCGDVISGRHVPNAEKIILFTDCVLLYCD